MTVFILKGTEKSFNKVSDKKNTWHESPLLEPEDGRERPREEDPLHACVRDHALGERGRLGIDPLEGPPGIKRA